MKVVTRQDYEQHLLTSVSSMMGVRNGILKIKRIQRVVLAVAGMTSINGEKN